MLKKFKNWGDNISPLITLIVLLIILIINIFTGSYYYTENAINDSYETKSHTVLDIQTCLQKLESPTISDYVYKQDLNRCITDAKDFNSDTRSQTNTSKKVLDTLFTGLNTITPTAIVILILLLLRLFPQDLGTFCGWMKFIPIYAVGLVIGLLLHMSILSYIYGVDTSLSILQTNYKENMLISTLIITLPSAIIMAFMDDIINKLLKNSFKVNTFPIGKRRKLLVGLVDYKEKLEQQQLALNELLYDYKADSFSTDVNQFLEQQLVIMRDLEKLIDSKKSVFEKSKTKKIKLSATIKAGIEKLKSITGKVIKSITEKFKKVMTKTIISEDDRENIPDDITNSIRIWEDIQQNFNSSTPKPKPDDLLTTNEDKQDDTMQRKELLMNIGDKLYEDYQRVTKLMEKLKNKK